MGKYNVVYLTVPVTPVAKEDSLKSSDRLCQLVGYGWEMVSTAATPSALYYILRKLAVDCTLEENAIATSEKPGVKSYE